MSTVRYTCKDIWNQRNKLEQYKQLGNNVLVLGYDSENASEDNIKVWNGEHFVGMSSGLLNEYMSSTRFDSDLYSMFVEVIGVDMVTAMRMCLS